MRPPLVRPWTGDDMDALKRLWAAGLPVRLIAIRLRRSAHAVSAKARKLALGRLRGKSPASDYPSTMTQ